MELHIYKDSITKKPIETWWDLVRSNLPEEKLTKGLRDIYKIHGPSVAEIVMESYCPNNCQHCIYPPDYHFYNKTLSEAKWVEALERLYVRIGLRRFVFGGRSLSMKDLNIIRAFKNNFPDITVGIIGDGITLEPVIKDIIRLDPDWVDISLDGLEKDHDIQRNSPGAFQRTIQVLEQLKNSEGIGKVNILSCLTALNIDSVIEMIEVLNRRNGLKNFFITPITVLEGTRPDPSLEPEMKDFVRFIDSIISGAEGFHDTWVEIDIYEARHAKAIQKLRHELFDQFNMEDEHLEFVMEEGDSEVHLDYYPSSLTGLREFIINSDGNIIPPKVMAMGKIPEELIFGNILELRGGPGIFENLVDQKAFSFYMTELLEERALLRQ